MAEMSIVDYIPFGEENAVKRWELMDKIMKPDREIRRMIEDARRSGVIILNLSNGNGYFRPDKKEEILRYIRQEEARARSIHRNLKAAKKALRAIDGQLTLYDF